MWSVRHCRLNCRVLRSAALCVVGDVLQATARLRVEGGVDVEVAHTSPEDPAPRFLHVPTCHDADTASDRVGWSELRSLTPRVRVTRGASLQVVSAQLEPNLRIFLRKFCEKCFTRSVGARTQVFCTHPDRSQAFRSGVRGGSLMRSRRGARPH